MLLSPWMKCSQDEFKATNTETKKRPRRYTEGNSSSKRCETSFENKRKKLDGVMTRGSPAVDCPGKRSNNFQNAFKMYCEPETESLPGKTKTIPVRNDQSPIILSQIAEKVKLRKRKIVVAGEHNYSKVTDHSSRIKYSKRKKRKREILSSPGTVKSGKEFEFRKNVKNVEAPAEESGNVVVKKPAIKETKNVYAKKARVLKIRKKYSRPRLVTPDKKINRTEPETVVTKSSSTKIKRADHVSAKKVLADSCSGDEAPNKDETSRNRRRKWSLGILPSKKRKVRNTEEIPHDDKSQKPMKGVVSVRTLMKQRNAVLAKMNSEALLQDRKEISDCSDDENCYDKPEIMTLLLNLTKTINEMSSLDGPTKFKKQKTRKSKTSKAQPKTDTVGKKPENYKNLKALLAAGPKSSSESRNIEAGDPAVRIASGLPGSERSSNDSPDAAKNVENPSLVVGLSSHSVHTGENEEPNRNYFGISAAQNISESEKSNFEVSILPDRSEGNTGEESREMNAEISKDIFSPDVSVDTTVEENAEKSKDALVNNLATEEGRGQVLSNSIGEKSDGENSATDEERAKQMSLVRFLRSSIGIPERTHEDDKDTVIFNLSDVSRPLPMNSSKSALRTKKSSVRIDKMRRLKMDRLRKKRNMFHENKKFKRKAKFKRGASKKASIKTTKKTETTERSTPVKDVEFLTTLKQVSNLVKKLHESHQVILFLEKDMASKPELSDHFKLVISAQYANYRSNITEYKDMILQGIDKMSGILMKSSLVTAEISKEALLSEEEVGNVISRCVLEKDVLDQDPKESGGDGSSVSVAERARNDISTGKPASSQSPRENKRMDGCTSVDTVSSNSLEIPDSTVASTVPDSGPLDVGKPARFSSDENSLEREQTRAQNFSDSGPSTPTPISLSNGPLRKFPVPRKDKNPSTKSIGLQNHPFKISMTKSGLCLRLGDGAGGFVPLENHMTQSIIHRVATSYFAQSKKNEKESTVKSSSELHNPAADGPINRPASTVSDNPQKEPSKFLQGFVREFVGPLRHSVILPNTKSVNVVGDRAQAETPNSARPRFFEPGRTKQTTTQVFVVKLKEPEVRKVEQKEGTNGHSDPAPSMHSQLKAVGEDRDREMLITKARNTLQAALLKATQAKGPEKRPVSAAKSQAVLSQNYQKASSSIANPSPLDNCTLQTTEKVCSIASEAKRPEVSKTLNEDLLRTSPDTQKKAMAQLIELSKKLVETRSLLRRSGFSASNTATPKKSDSSSGRMSNGHVSESSTPASKPSTGGHRLSEPDASSSDAKASTTPPLRRSERLSSSVSDAKASATITLRRSKRFQTRNDSSEEPSTSNVSPASYRNEQEGGEKETTRKRAGMHSIVPFIKTERESVDENLVLREESSSAENQSDEEDVYFDMDKVKKELEDVHGLIHFICAENKCMNPGTEICTGCQSVLYCGRQCQARHWNRKHYKHCEELKKMAEERKKNKILET